MAKVERLLEETLVEAVVIDVRAGFADAAFGLAERFPVIPVIALSAFRPDDGKLLSRCYSAGLHSVLVAGVDDAVAGEIVAGCCMGNARGTELTEAPRLLRLTEPVQLDAWQEILSRVDSPTTTSCLAEALGVSREHLSREFAAGGAPNLKRVIDLARLACAAQLLQNPGYSVTRVSRILHFSSPSHLAGSARRIAGVTPSELGSLGPRGVLHRFRRGRTRSRL